MIAMLQECPHNCSEKSCKYWESRVSANNHQNWIVFVNNFNRLDGFKNCPFGSTSIRTLPLTKKHESLMPGPADYQENVKSQRTNDRLSHTFASTTNRFYSPSATVCSFSSSFFIIRNLFATYRLFLPQVHMKCQMISVLKV